MKIGGLQKVSTIDYPGEISCVIFLWGCNFRCGFCHNPELVVRGCEGEFSSEEVLDFLSRRVGKLDAVVISGGEPLISLDFDFVRRVKAMGFKVKVDTNGTSPDVLRDLIEEGLVDYVAMDVKGCREDYSRVCGVEVDVEKIEESIRIVEDFGRHRVGGGRFGIPNKAEGSATPSSSCGNLENKRIVDEGLKSEFRTTVVPGLHDCENLVRMGEWMNEVCGGKPGRIFLQGFKGGGEMIDSSFGDKADVLEVELVRMKVELDGFFGDVGIRV